MKKVLITGIDGFTGVYLEELLTQSGYDVFGLVLSQSKKSKHIPCNIIDKREVVSALKNVKPDFIIHLAGMSFVRHDDIRQIYDINFFGTLNILDALLDIRLKPEKVVLASSANVYGNPSVGVIDETVCPAPVNHYANSKLAMEFMARTYFGSLNILMTRPFNYTGIGQSEQFLIPKIVKHFKEKKRTIELGNLEVVRDFSDVRLVTAVYKMLMECDARSEIVNVCSGIGVSLLEIIRLMNAIAGYEIMVKVNPDFVRANEVEKLIGSPDKLFSLVGKTKMIPIAETLKWMFESS